MHDPVLGILTASAGFVFGALLSILVNSFEGPSHVVVHNEGTRAELASTVAEATALIEESRHHWRGQLLFGCIVMAGLASFGLVDLVQGHENDAVAELIPTGVLMLLYAGRIAQARKNLMRAKRKRSEALGALSAWRADQT